MKKNRLRKKKKSITANTIAKIVLVLLVLVVCAIAVTSNAYVDEKKVLETLREGDNPNAFMVGNIHRGIITDTTLVAVSTTYNGEVLKTVYNLDSNWRHEYSFKFKGVR